MSCNYLLWIFFHLWNFMYDDQTVNQLWGEKGGGALNRSKNPRNKIENGWAERVQILPGPRNGLKNIFPLPLVFFTRNPPPSPQKILKSLKFNTSIVNKNVVPKKIVVLPPECLVLHHVVLDELHQGTGVKLVQSLLVDLLLCRRGR